MKRLTGVFVFCLSAATAFPAQVPEKSAKNTSASKLATTNASQSNEEVNIRAYVQLLRTDLYKNRTQIVSDVMQFDADQAAAFWPIYKDFQGELGKVGDQIVELVKDYVLNYDTITNEKADQLATKLLDIEQQRNELKRKYYGRVKSAIDPITAARFLQVENQIEKLLDLQIAAQLPVVGTTER